MKNFLHDPRNSSIVPLMRRTVQNSMFDQNKPFSFGVYVDSEGIGQPARSRNLIRSSDTGEYITKTRLFNYIKNFTTKN